MKPILLFLLVMTILIQNSNASTMRGISNSHKEVSHLKNVQKHTVKCYANNHYTFVISKEKYFYSDRYKIFKTQKEAIHDSCRKKIARAKSNAVMCSTQKEIRNLISKPLVDKKPIYSKQYKNCVRLLSDINIKIAHHYYVENYKSYYAIVYNDVIYYIQTKDLSISKAKNIYKKRLKKIKRKKINNMKKKISNRSKTKKRKYNKKITKRSMAKKKKIRKHVNSKKRTKSISIKHETSNYTYRCIATHGVHTINANNKSGMSEATDKVWSKCQNLKAVDEVCLIKDCYKLILN